MALRQAYDFVSPIDRESVADQLRASVGPSLDAIARFKIGDRVLWRGRPGTVVGHGTEADQPVCDVELDTPLTHWLSKDGRDVRWAYVDQLKRLPEADDPAMRCQTVGA